MNKVRLIRFFTYLTVFDYGPMLLKELRVDIFYFLLNSHMLCLGSYSARLPVSPMEVICSKVVSTAQRKISADNSFRLRMYFALRQLLQWVTKK